MKVSARSGVYVLNSWGRGHAAGQVVCQQQRARQTTEVYQCREQGVPCSLLAVSAYCSQETKKQQHYKDRIKCCAAGYGTARY